MRIALSHAHSKFAQGASHDVTYKTKLSEWPMSKEINKCVVEMMKDEKDIEVLSFDPEAKNYSKHLNDTVREINSARCDLAIETHFNSHTDSKANGFETLYWHTSKSGKKIAEIMNKQMDENLSMFNRGIKPRKNILFLSKTNCPAIIVEAGFLSNPNDFKFISSFNATSIIARCISKTILEYKKTKEGE